MLDLKSSTEILQNVTLLWNAKIVRQAIPTTVDAWYKFDAQIRSKCPVNFNIKILRCKLMSFNRTSAKPDFQVIIPRGLKLLLTIKTKSFECQ